MLSFLAMVQSQLLTADFLQKNQGNLLRGIDNKNCYNIMNFNLFAYVHTVSNFNKMLRNCNKSEIRSFI
jgi:hypothetical protein